MTQHTNVTTTLGDLLSDAQSELEELGNEMRDAFDNTPEGLQKSPIGEARESAADMLEALEMPDLPENIASIGYIYSHLPLKKKASRSDRRNAAVDKVATVIGYLGDLRDVEDGLEENKKNNDRIEELETLIEELESYQSDAESVEFPGMYMK